MQKEFTVKALGNFNIPEVKQLLPRFPQPAKVLYHAENTSEKPWESLNEQEQKVYLDKAGLQKSMNSEIKELAKKRYSLMHAVAQIDSDLAKAKENYEKIRAPAKPKRPSAFQLFKTEWIGQHGETSGKDLRNTWKSLNKTEKSKYFSN